MKKIYSVDGNIIMKRYLRSNDVAKALDLYQRLKESGQFLTTSSYTNLMQHLFRLNEYQKGCELYNEMLERGVNPDWLTVITMVSAHVRQNHIAEAWKVFKSTKDLGIEPAWKSYTVFINELCKVSNADEIVKVLNEMRDSKIIRNDIFHAIISYVEEKKEDLKNIDLIKHMQRLRQIHLQNDQKPNNDESSGQEFNMKFKNGQIEAGKIDIQLVEPISKDYNEEDLQKICIILSSSTEWCLVQNALKKSTVHFTPEIVVKIMHNYEVNCCSALHFFSWVQKQPGYSHTTETYNIAIKLAGSGKDFRHMRNLFFEMRKSLNIMADTWTIMIIQYARAGLTKIALKVFGEMKGSGCKPIASTYKYLIILLCGRKGRKVDEAIILFKEMVRIYIPDKELVEIYLACLCDVGKLSDARKCVDTLRRVGFTSPLSYSLYIRALCRAGRLEEALALVDEAGAERSTLDQYIYGSLVHGLLHQGRLEDALAKVESMKQSGINPTVHVYTSLIVHFFKEKQIGRALEIFKEMQDKGCDPTVITCSALIRGYLNTGMVTEAWDVFYRMKLKGPSPDFKTYSMFITCLCNVGKSEEARELITEMLDNGIVPSTINFRTVIFALNREGKHSLARTVLHQKSALTSKRKFLT